MLFDLSIAVNSEYFSPSTQEFSSSSNSLGSPLEIDVKPRKKEFSTKHEKHKYIESYSKKIKTEICKNWEMKGSCKYGDYCSFAHGKQELKQKTHLNSNFKTKPCKQFFETGYCSYGNRCQYLHSELKTRNDYQKFLLKIYSQNGISLNCLTCSNCNREEDRLKLIEDMLTMFSFNKISFDQIFELMPHKRNRLVFDQNFQ